MKIVQIDGIRGLITAAFIAVCLFAGFVVFPGYAAMYSWNKYLAGAYMFPVLNLFQGILLWAIVAISYAILSKRGLAVSFVETPELKDEELEEIIRKARMNSKMQILNKMMKSAEKIELSKKKEYEEEKSIIASSIGSVTPVCPEKNEEDKVSEIK